MSALFSPRRSLFRRGLLALLLLFVAAQSLSWMHRAFHGSPDDLLQHAAAVQLAEPTGGAQPAHTWMQGLFGDHAEPSDCRLFDAVAQPSCTPGMPVIPLAVPANAILLASNAEFVARWSALFEARGPPPSP